MMTCNVVKADKLIPRIILCLPEMPRRNLPRQMARASHLNISREPRTLAGAGEARMEIPPQVRHRCTLRPVVIAVPPTHACPADDGGTHGAYPGRAGDTRGTASRTDGPSGAGGRLFTQTSAGRRGAPR